MPEKLAGISNEAITEAAGHGWDHWLAELDARDAEGLTHTEIVAELDDEVVESGWWRQTIANAYEVERGIREVGETVDAGFQVDVQRTLPVERGLLWELLLSPGGGRSG